MKKSFVERHAFYISASQSSNIVLPLKIYAFTQKIVLLAKELLSLLRINEFSLVSNNKEIKLIGIMRSSVVMLKYS